MTPEQAKQALKTLRQEQKDTVRRVSSQVKTYNQDAKKVKAALEGGPRTVPEIAEAAGIPAPQTLWYVMSMKKYGQVVEAEKDGDYFRYALAPADNQPES